MKKLIFMLSLLILAGCTVNTQKEGLISALSSAKLDKIEYCSFIIENLKEKETDLTKQVSKTNKEELKSRLLTTTKVKEEIIEKCELLKTSSNQQICQQFIETLNDKIKASEIKLEVDQKELKTLKQNKALEMDIISKKQEIMQDNIDIKTFEEFLINLQLFC